MQKIQIVGLSVLSGLLFSISWPLNGFPFLLFIAFVPLLFIEESISTNKINFVKGSVFFYSFIGFMVWNLLTTYWIKNSTLFGATMAVLITSSTMAFFFWLNHFLNRVLFINKSSGFVFVITWISYEFVQLNWEFSWPWLNLGNGFSSWPKLIQWYEFTGIFGGTLWILIVNILFFHAIKKGIQASSFKLFLLKLPAPTLMILIPILFSLILFHTYDEKGKSIDVVVVQPNLDPYNEKFGGMEYELQIKKMIDLAKLKTSDQTRLVIFPETAIQEGSLWEHALNSSFSIDSLRQFLVKFPLLDVIIGASTYREYHQGEPHTTAARQFGNSDYWYDAYNTAVFINQTPNIQLYHKSKLVVGVERMPFPKTFVFLKDFALDMGGIVGTLGIDLIQRPFLSDKDSLQFGTLICYESVYGEFCSRFVKNGADLLVVITNDGWWGNTPGHRQHFSYASIRAIESRRSVARSANTGISALINQRGEVLESTAYWEDDVICQKLKPNSEITFYVKYGDYIGRMGLFACVLLLIIALIAKILKKGKKPNLL